MSRWHLFSKKVSSFDYCNQSSKQLKKILMWIFFAHLNFFTIHSGGLCFINACECCERSDAAWYSVIRKCMYLVGYAFGESDCLGSSQDLLVKQAEEDLQLFLGYSVLPMSRSNFFWRVLWIFKDFFFFFLSNLIPSQKVSVFSI